MKTLINNLFSISSKNLLSAILVIVLAGSQSVAASGSKALKLFYSSQRTDNFTTATLKGSKSATSAGYRYSGVEGHVLSSFKAGTKALKLYYSPTRKDNFLTATPQGERAAKGAGYRFVRVEGYVYTSSGKGRKPLKLYYSPGRKDNFTTATTKGENNAKRAGYRFSRIEGYVLVNPIPQNNGGRVTGPVGAENPVAKPPAILPVRTLYNFDDHAHRAKWETTKLGDPSGDFHRLTFGKDMKSKGYAGIRHRFFEDGNQGQVLYTRPKCTRNGTIRGYFSETPVLPKNAWLSGKIGKKMPGLPVGKTDVYFLIYIHYYDNGVKKSERLLKTFKHYNRKLKPVHINLSKYAGKRVAFELRLDVSRSSDGDISGIWDDMAVKARF